MKSAGSVQSVASVGIGDQASVAGGGGKPKEVPPRPMPEGVISSNEPVYDCIVYLIFCPAHENIAVTSRSKSKCIWLPFVALPDGETWIKASHDGVDVLIGRNDPEMDAEEAERQAPIYRMNYLHVMRLQLPSRRTVLRLSQFIYLEANPFFQCCRDTDRVSWLPVADVQQASASHRSLPRPLWGPEVRILTTMVTSTQRQVVNEFTLSNALYYLNLGGSRQQEVLQAAKLMENHVLEIYSDYIEHCYPAFYMALESFRLYLLRFSGGQSGVASFEEKALERLFNAFRLTEESRSFLDFHELLIGLAAFDPGCPNNLELRQRFIFKYYDTEKKGRLDLNNVALLLADANPSWPPAKVQDEARLAMANRTTLSFEDFVGSFRERLTSGASPFSERLCRAPKSILQQISSLLASKKKERLKSKQACQGVMKAKRATKGTCWSCRAQQYEYGNHCVTIDTVGRSVEPTILPVAPSPATPFSVSRSHYSLEYVFSIASVPNIFIDLIRGFYAKQKAAAAAATQQQPNGQQQPPPPGLMTVPQEWYIFYKYLRVLCNDLSAMLSTEKKLIKLNGPAVVVGDLAGSLPDLLRLEALFWQSFPVTSESLLFLGNYSGSAGFGIECLIYLFSLKLCLPNKVVLLRGAAELCLSTSTALVQECTRKFGAENGQLVAGVFMEIFAKLPVAVLIDENILCTHSGIPAAPRLEPALLKLPAEMTNLLHDSPLAYGIVTRYPKGDGQATPGRGGGGGGKGGSRSPSSPKSIRSGKSVKSKSKLGGLCQKLFGGKVGDTRFHQDFKSISKKKSPKSMKSKLLPSMRKKSLRLGKSPKSAKSVKTIGLVKVKLNKTSRAPSFHRQKSKKSVRQQKSGSARKSKRKQNSASRGRWKVGALKKKKTSPKSIKSRKSLKTLKSQICKSLGGVKSKTKSSRSSSPTPISKQFKSAGSVRSNKSIKSQAKSVMGTKSSKVVSSKRKSKSPSSAMQFTLSKAGISKRKMLFLKSCKMSRKSASMLKKEKSGKSPTAAGGGGGSKSAVNKNPPPPPPPHQPVSMTRGRETYDQNEFLDFMKVNDLSYLIRSASVCKMGFKLKFSRQCLTVFSCSNFYRDNDGAVALIDSTSLSIRFIRYKSTTEAAAAPTNQSAIPSSAR